MKKGAYRVFWFVIITVIGVVVVSALVNFGIVGKTGAEKAVSPGITSAGYKACYNNCITLCKIGRETNCDSKCQAECAGTGTSDTGTGGTTGPVGPPPECSYMEPLVSFDYTANTLTVKFTDNTDTKCGDIEIKQDSCTGTKVASCDVSSGVVTNGMLCEVTFDLPATAGEYTYYTCSGTYTGKIDVTV